MFPKSIRKKDRTFLDTFVDQYCLVKNKRGSEGHHIITRKAGGPDEVWNVMPLCREAHSEVHQIGMTRFARKYPRVSSWLIANGWSFDNVKNKWVKPGDPIIREYVDDDGNKLAIDINANLNGAAWRDD